MVGPGRILLASTSPRRSALLQDAGIPFALIPPGHEPEDSRGDPRELVIQRAVAKALGAQRALQDEPPKAGSAAAGGTVPGSGLNDVVLGVDTVVESAGVALGKPADAAEAKAMLAGLAAAGQHRVHSAHCALLATGGDHWVELTTAVVGVAPDVQRWLPPWLASGLWQGKAGGYGIQDTEADFVRVIAGEMDTVVGMSVAAVHRLMAEVLGVAGPEHRGGGGSGC